MAHCRTPCLAENSELSECISLNNVLVYDSPKSITEMTSSIKPLVCFPMSRSGLKCKQNVCYILAFNKKKVGKRSIDRFN